MAKSKQYSKNNDLIDNLISTTSDFNKGSEDFNILKKCVIKELFQHKCLDVNHYNVQRALNGILLKLKVHGHVIKSNQLEELSHTFLKSPVFEDKEEDLKWSILSFLLHLGEHPARDGLGTSIYEDDVCANEIKTSSDHQEWIQDSMKQSQNVTERDDTLAEWSDEEIPDIETDVAEDVVSTVDDPIHIPKQETPRLFQQQPENNEISEQNHRRNHIIKECQLSQYWLENSIQSPYWKEIDSKEIPILSEYVIMRECLWTLMCPKSGFIFKLADNGFSITPVATSTLPQFSLHSMLSVFAENAFKFYRIDSWLKGWKNTGGRNTQLKGAYYHGIGRNPCISYLEGLWTWSLSFIEKFSTLELEVKQQIETRTLIWLKNESHSTFKCLSAIYDIHQTVFFGSEKSGNEQYLRLLSILIKHIQLGREVPTLLALFKCAIKSLLNTIQNVLWQFDFDSLNTNLQDLGIRRVKIDSELANKWKYEIDPEVNLALPGLEFIRCLQKPLLEVCKLRGVVSNLKISEEKDSNYLENIVFGIISEKMSGKYFKNAFLTQHSNGGNMKNMEEKNDYDDNSLNELSNLSISQNLKKTQEASFNDEMSSQKLDLNTAFPEGKHTTLSATDSNKQVLSSIAEESNKSLFQVNNEEENSGERHLDKIDVTQSSDSNDISQDIKSTLEVVQEADRSDDDDKENMLKKTVDNIQDEETSPKQSNWMPDLTSSTLDFNWEIENRTFMDYAFELAEKVTAPPTVKRFTPVEETSNTVAFAHLLKQAILPVVREAANDVGKRLLKDLNEKYLLMSQLKMFRDICLLQTRLKMNEFYLHIFKMVDESEIDSETELTHSLHESISVEYPEWALSIDVKYKNAKQGVESQDLCSSLALNLQELWPLCLVVDSSCLEKYNLIFSFCLVIRRALYCLQGLRFKDAVSFISYADSDSESDGGMSEPEDGEASSPLPQRLHQLSLLRYWLIYLVGCLHSHFAHSALVPFAENVDGLSRVEHFSDFIDEHRKSLNKACHGCLLSANSSSLQNKIGQIFILVQMVRDLWLGPPQNLTDSKLDELMASYKRCHRFLANFFSSISQSESEATVSELAECLSYNRPT